MWPPSHTSLSAPNNTFTLSLRFPDPAMEPKSTLVYFTRRSKERMVKQNLTWKNFNLALRECSPDTIN